MYLIILTDNDRIKSIFDKPSLKKVMNIAYYPVGKIDKIVEKYDEDKFYYVDISNLNKEFIDTLIEKIQKSKINIAFIDPDNNLKDPAVLFFNGLFDYLGKDTIKMGVKVYRIKSALKFRKSQFKNYKRDKNEKKLTREFGYCNKWKDIQEGKEYLFWILYIGIDNVEKIKESMNAEYRKYLFGKFKEFVTRIVKRSNGKIWMWNEHGGVVLFPYDGRTIDAIATSLRLILNRRIFNIELKDSYELFYRIALHKGKTIYKKRGNTGTIVSDDINKVFHLGLDFAESAGLYLTEAALELLPEGAMNAFENLGNYEGLRIFKFYDIVK